ncbi:hypothetical protein MMC13_000028 [Lambiella insularis]|nr:hypothetical protein [Lambiella insularis]
MLRKAWTTESRSEAFRDQLGKRYWATPGPYLRRRFLTAFVTEIGQEFEEVVRGGEVEEMEIAGGEGAEEAEDLAVVGVAAQWILLSNKKRKEFADTFEDPDDSEDSEEEFEGLGP